MATYNGWKNRSTWNVALWINNDEPLYRTAINYCKERQSKNLKITYIGFIKYAGLSRERTPDGILYDGQQLDYKALNEMMDELTK